MLVNAILYDMPESSGWPHDLILYIVGRGLPNDEKSPIPIFKDKYRNTDYALVSKAFTTLFVGFDEDRALDDERLLRLCMPLLKGGTTLLIDKFSRGMSTVVFSQHSEAGRLARRGLLYLKMLERKPKDMGTRSEMWQKAARAVVMGEGDEAKTKYLTGILGREVVHIDLSKADRTVFHNTPMRELEMDAARELLRRRTRRRRRARSRWPPRFRRSCSPRSSTSPASTASARCACCSPTASTRPTASRTPSSRRPPTPWPSGCPCSTTTRSCTR